MKVLHVIPSLSGGGAERLVSDLKPCLEQKGIEFSILTMLHNEEKHDISLKVTHPYSITSSFRLANMLKGSNPQITPDIIHCHLTPSQIFTPLAVQLAQKKKPLITTEHSTNNRRRKLPGSIFFDRWLYSNFLRIVCVSKGVANELESYIPTVSSRLVVIQNGVDLKRFVTTYKTNDSCDYPVIISVGRLSPIKNYQTALQAFSLLAKQGSRFEYRILGCGKDEIMLRTMAYELGISDSVKFLGYRKDVPEQLAAADIFLLTSTWEGFGLAAVEAMAMRLPIIVSNVPGVREFISRSASAGFLVDPHDPKHIADRIAQLISKPELRYTMGLNGYKQAQKYSIEETANQYSDLYKNIFDKTKT